MHILFGDAHWLTVCSQAKDCFGVYNSLDHGYVSRSFFHQITDTTHSEDDDIFVKIEDVQQQLNSVDCGIFAIVKIFFDEDIAKDPGNFMAPCSICKEWHKACLKILVHVFRDESFAKYWNCNSCIKKGSTFCVCVIILVY